MTRNCAAIVFTVLMGLASAVTGADFKHENKPQNLQALFERIHQEVHAKKDPAQAIALFRAMMPDEMRVRKALKEKIDAGTVQKITDMHRKLNANMNPEGIAKIARATQKVVRVHGASTEDIARYSEGSVAFKSFPGGAKTVASQSLRPATTFYEVEYLEPGKDSGMKYHLIYWDGKQWSMLGPVWRALKS